MPGAIIMAGLGGFVLGVIATLAVQVWLANAEREDELQDEEHEH